jgi:hypothetical protein
MCLIFSTVFLRNNFHCDKYLTSSTLEILAKKHVDLRVNRSLLLHNFYHSWAVLTNFSKTCYVARPVAQAVSRWLPTAAAWVRVRAAYGGCGGQSGTGTGFLRVLRFPLPIIPPVSPSS